MSTRTIRFYEEKGLTFVVEKRDATNFSYPVKNFDHIMANHLLFHIKKTEREKLYIQLKEYMDHKGTFSCTLIGKGHNCDLHDLLREYYPEINIPSSGFDIWLETAEEELSKYFNVEKVMEQKNDLLVPDEEVILNYVASYSEEAKEIVEKDREEFYKHVQDYMNEDGYMFIHKSTGLVICKAQTN